MINAVSETSLLTLKSRVVEALKENPIISDTMGLECFTRLQSLLPVEQRERILYRKLPATLTRHIALRARKYDSYARRFLDENPSGLVVSLGAGFDTRYWRVSDKAWQYVEIDLPEVIAAKKQVLGEIPYQVIGCSVLEESWIEDIVSMQKENVLFLAEGLFMYLPGDGVRRIFRKLSESFTKSQIVFEVVNEKYTRGLWKKIVASKISKLGTQAGTSYDFGIRNAGDVEAYGDNIRVLEEWSYLEDEDIKPEILKLLGHFKLFSRTQWTIQATIG